MEIAQNFTINHIRLKPNNYVSLETRGSRPLKMYVFRKPIMIR